MPHEEHFYPPYSALLGSLSLAALSLAFSTPAEAVVLIGNLPQANDSFSFGLTGTNTIASSFTISSGSSQDLDNVVLRLSNYDPSETLLVQIRKLLAV